MSNNHHPANSNHNHHVPTLVIVGGVAGGASAATRARRMNEHARIIILEKDAHASFANCGLPYYLGGEITSRDKLIVAPPELFAKRFNIDLRTRHEVKAIDPRRKELTVLKRDTGETYALAYDKLILAPGASPFKPDLPGGAAPNVFTLRNLEDTDVIHSWISTRKPEHALVIGGGYIGLEMAEQLRHRGLAVTVVEASPQAMLHLDPEMAQPVHDELRRNGVELMVNTTVKQLAADAAGEVHAAELSTGQTLETDLVILSIGVRPNVALADRAKLRLGESGGIAVDEFMRTSEPDIYAVGDAAEVPYGPTASSMRIALAGPANRAGRLAGEHAVTGQSDVMDPVMGTAVVRVFGLTAGLTGLSLKSARKAGIDATAVTIVANHHAGYFPGAKPITLKLVYTPESGFILGAQAVGAEGVDKRLDVISTAMHFGGSVRDLAGLDLAYAPPFGSAKDPVHMAGFAACNQLDGHVQVLQPDADLSAFQVVDVRSAAESQKQPLADAPHAVNIPVDELRSRLSELDKRRPTVVSCQTGLRSYVAARILMQHGFDDVFNLTGAATMRGRVVRMRNEITPLTSRDREGAVR
jgi:NADPH-dependent 2,4-dienoyl-CoA reductase/sulfur reductase-like enzyme/rhodanese-related sulfurtransferase